MKVNWFILVVVILQLLGAGFALLQKKDLFTCGVFILYALANVMFAVGANQINSLLK